ncbi:diguanylate cyclase domain-containing protein [Pseudidiomarina sp.]|uniref:diguanylate cyclase domain-containing protein n=1 Tax=Pseudidiomarina sp. TaxID=2081707 RepID=UPI003A96DF51
MKDSATNISDKYKTLIRRVVLATFVTGVIASVATLIPLSFYIKQSANNMGLAYASAQALSVQQQLQHYQAIANQFASRTQIRNLFESYTQGDVSSELLRHETTNRIKDAAVFIPELIVGYRIQSNGTVIAAYEGPSAGIIESIDAIDTDQLSRQGLYYLSYGNNPADVKILITAAAPIYDTNRRVIGVDVLLFSNIEILNIIAELNNSGQTTEFRLVNTRENVYIEFDQRSGRLTQKAFSRGELFNIVAYGSAPFTYSETLDDDTKRQHFFIPFVDSDWGLVAVSTNPSMFKALLSEFIWIAAVILLTVMLGTLLLRRHLQPIIRAQLSQHKQLRETNHKLRLANTVFEKAKEAIVITDQDLVILRANQAFADLFEIEPGLVRDKNLLLFADKERMTRATQNEVRKHVKKHDSWQGEVWYKKPKGDSFPALQTISPVRNSDGNALQLIHIFNDISVEMHDHERLRKLALTDLLTHLPNRFAILQHIDDAIARITVSRQQFAVLFLDLDKFKPVNDTHGHAVGDALLQAIGPRISEQLRAADIVGRLGGDEFVIVIEHVQQQADIERIAGDIIKAVQEPFRIGELNIHVGGSMGIAIFPQHGKNAQRLLKLADEAMYKAKQGGRNRYCLAE